MDPSVKLIIHRGTVIFDSVNVTPNAATRYVQQVAENRTDKQRVADSNNFKENRKVDFVCINKRGCNAYLASAYILTVIESHVYRKAALEKLLQFLSYKCIDRENIQTILIKLRTPRKQYLDYTWNEKMTQMALERREVDHAMSWLSTLGGAFSALGEEFEYCAEMAGKISVKQFELALRLGDPLLVARCKLYAALSMIQRGQLRTPKQIVRNLYKCAVAQNDNRLQNMCQGIWAKLRHCYKIKRQKKKNP